MNRAHAMNEAFEPARDVAALAASVVAPLVLYVLTMPRTVVLEDDGLFLMAGAHLGVAHPPGYPLYTFIVYLFTQLPFGSAAFLGHLSSAVLGALACGCVYLCGRLIGASSIPALTAAWLFAASEHFWSQAIVTEVYTLNALFFFGLYTLLLFGIRQPHRTGIWIVAAAAYGLSLANHLPLTVLSTPGLVVLAFTVRRTVYRKLPLLLAILGCCAAFPYIWMIWRSHQEILINFYGPIDTLKEVWFYVSRQGYVDVDLSPSAGWVDRFKFMRWLGNEFLWQLTLPGFALAVFGLVILFRRRQVAIAWSGVLVFLANSIVLIVLLRFDFDDFQVAVFRPYSLTCYGIQALWLGIGLQVVYSWLARSFSSRTVRQPKVRIGAAALAGLALACWSVNSHWQANDRADNDFAERYNEMVLDLVLEDGVLFVFGDPTGHIGYDRFVENRRPDVTLYNLQGLVFGTRLVSPFMSAAARKETLEKFVDSTERALFFPLDVDIYPERQKWIYGFLLQTARDGKPGTIKLKRHPRGEEFFVYLINWKPIDRWERVRRNELLFQYGQYLGLIHFTGHPLRDHVQQLFQLAHGSYASLLGMATVLLDNGNSSNWEQVASWLTRAETLKHEALKKKTLADLYYHKGRLLQNLGKANAAVVSLRKSRDIYPHPHNKALKALDQYRIDFKRVNPPGPKSPRSGLPLPQ